MSTSGETADLVVKESIQITESAVKLAGLGAKIWRLCWWRWPRITPSWPVRRA